MAFSPQSAATERGAGYPITIAIAIQPGHAAPGQVKLGFITPVPLLDTLTGHNDHRDALVKAIGGTPIDVGLESGDSMLLGLCDPSDACVRQRHASPTVRDHYRRSFDGFRLRSPTGDLMLDFDRTARRVPDQGFAVLNFKIRPGPYVLSYCRPSVSPDLS